MNIVPSGKSGDVLKGTSLDIYFLLLKTNKPYGIRGIQRALNLSSPSVAQYHLSKLEHAGFLKREGGNYVIDRVLLENRIRISNFLIPRYLFYSIFGGAILLFGLFLRPNVIDRNYFFFMTTTLLFVLIFCYETVKALRKGGL